jgi:hypothetical protein
VRLYGATVVCIGLNQPANYKALKCAEGDAGYVASVLREQGHNTVVLTGQDATREKIISTLDGVKDDQLIVYFAGHGEKGQLILADGPVALNEIAARSTFVVVDCCYVGGALQEEGRTKVFAAAQYEAFETDGHGLFTKYLLKWLNGGRWFGDEGMVEFIRKAIGKETGGWQKPVLGYA